MGPGACTSPGCIGKNSLIAEIPRECSNASMYSISGVGLELPLGACLLLVELCGRFIRRYNAFLVFFYAFLGFGKPVLAFSADLFLL